MSKTESQLQSTVIDFRRYSSAKKIVLDFFYNQLKSVRSEQKKLDYVISDCSNLFFENNKNLTVKEVIKKMQKKDLWGYCSIDKKRNTRCINIWAKRKAEVADVATLISHELAHAIGINSERSANQYGYIASITIQILLKRFKKKIT